MQRATDVPEERLQKVASQLHSVGVEIPPDEVKAVFEEAMRKVRLNMEELGYAVPESDVELLTLLASMS